MPAPYIPHSVFLCNISLYLLYDIRTRASQGLHVGNRVGGDDRGGVYAITLQVPAWVDAETLVLCG
jgi:hypothetical protein